MAHLVFSQSKRFVKSPEHARVHRRSRCEVGCWRKWRIDLGVDVSRQRDLARRTGLWFSRAGCHKNRPTERPHYTVRGFKTNGFAYRTIHAFSRDHLTTFLNGGVWKEDGRHLDVEQDCEPLWCMVALLPCSCVDVHFQKMHLCPS
jgi:hypothetical protein